MSIFDDIATAAEAASGSKTLSAHDNLKLIADNMPSGGGSSGLGNLVTEDLTAQVDGSTGNTAAFTLSNAASEIVLLEDAGRPVPPADITDPNDTTSLELTYDVPSGHELVVVYKKAVS